VQCGDKHVWQVLLLCVGFSSFGYTPRSGIAGSRASCIFQFFEELPDSHRVALNYNPVNSV
jgi:hypothetical protein